MRIKKFNEFNIKVPKEIIELSKVFKENGKSLYIVGGWPRDILMGLKPIDIDLATDSLPDETISFLSGKYKIDLVGKAFGVIIVQLGQMKIEIASFRTDLEDLSGGRHPEVKLGVSIEDDVLRRDLTISALFYDIEKGEIVDLVGGIKDIENKVIRMVGDPKLRLEEDQLRAMRVFRFATRYGFTIDKRTKDALIKNIDLSKIAKERVWDEIKKAFKQAKNFSDYIRLLLEYKIFEEILPKLKINSLVSDSKSLVIYLTNLLRENFSKNLLNELIQVNKFETDLARPIVFLIELSKLDLTNVFDLYKKKIVSKVDDATILEWLSIIGKENEPIYKAFMKYKPSVNSQELIEIGYKGAELGKKIKELELENFKKLYD